MNSLRDNHTPVTASNVPNAFGSINDSLCSLTGLRTMAANICRPTVESKLFKEDTMHITAQVAKTQVRRNGKLKLPSIISKLMQ